MAKYSSRLYYHQSEPFKSIYHEVNISRINETLKDLCFRNNFIFIEHKNIGIVDLWVDGIHLLNSGKVILGSNFVSEVNRYFGKSDNFPGNFIT